MNSISKRADKLLGIPVLFTLAGLESERSHKLTETVKSAAFLCLSSARDLIMALPFFSAFKYKYPECEITVFTVEENTEVAGLISEADRIVKLFPDNRSRSADIVKGFRNFDIWVDLGVWSRFEAIISIKALAKYKIGFKTPGEMRHFAYDRITEYNPKKHRAENFAKLASLLGLKIDLASHAMELGNHNPKPKTLVVNIFADNGKENNRLWPFENWKILLESLAKKGYKISLIGDKSQVAQADKFSESLSTSVDMDYHVGRLDMEGLKTLLLGSELVVSIDAMPLYLARHIGVPAVGIFGPTYPCGTYFNVGRNEAIVAGVNCVGCQNVYGDEKCHLKSIECMPSITPATVEERIMQICGGAA